MPCSSSSGPPTGALGKCNPRCYDRMNPFTECSGCTAPDFPAKWLGTYTGEKWTGYLCNVAPTPPTPPTAVPPAPTPKPPTAGPVYNCPDYPTCNDAKCPAGVAKGCSSRTTNGVTTATYQCGNSCTGKLTGGISDGGVTTPTPGIWNGGKACQVGSVQPRSLTKCMNCLASVQCQTGWFCCPYMKKCVESSSMPCSSSSGPPTGALGKCNPRCYDRMNPFTECSGCTAPDFPAKWLGTYTGEKWTGYLDCDAANGVANQPNSDASAASILQPYVSSLFAVLAACPLFANVLR